MTSHIKITWSILRKRLLCVIVLEFLEILDVFSKLSESNSNNPLLILTLKQNLRCISPWNSTTRRGDDLELSELATEEHLLNTGTETEKE